MRARETGDTRARVGMGLLFYPRGGSAQVTHYLATALIADGWDVELVSGSLGQPGDPTEAATFFAGLDVHPVDYTAAVAAYRSGGDPMRTAMPMHPSYEDRGGVPDRFLAAVEPALAEHLVDAWVRALPDSFLHSDIFHLHHLTPLHEAVNRLRPDAPIVAHLHGTELKFLQALPALPESIAPYAAFWSDRLRSIATMCRRLVVGSPTDKVSASSLLGVEPDRIDIVPGGVDTDSFRPQVLGDAERLAMFRRWLVDDPQGWDESCLPGSIRYSDNDLRGLLDPSTGEMRPVVLFVGRFTAVKRIPLLLRAWSRARRRFAGPAALVIWGGHPGEFEDEHPVALARRIGLDDVFFLGWRGHDELPSGLAASDLLVLPSVNESFGLVAIEAMATGIPVIATRSGGPPSFINTDHEAPTGWLVGPDDEAELADAMVEAVNQPDDRHRRGDRSLIAARTGYSWPAIAARFEAIYAQLLEDSDPR